MSTFEGPLILAAVLVILSVCGSKASSRFGIPSLLLFLLIGMGVGAEGFTRLIQISSVFAQRLGILALISILFSGGLNTDFKVVRPSIKPALVLSTFGVAIATLLVGVFSNLAIGFTLIEGCLLGATVASTDVAAVFTVLRAKNVSLKKGIAPLLELESALNDPMTVFLVLGFLSLLTSPEKSLLALVPSFFLQMALGAGMGWAIGKSAIHVINRIRLEFEGLYPVLSIALVLLSYGATQFFGGSGFLAVYVAGIVMGNGNLIHKKSLILFHEGIAWLMQITMFLVMGLLVSPQVIWTVAPYGLALSAFLVFIARPLSVFICFVYSRFSVQEKLMVSWAGLRGAAPIILATYPLVAQAPKAIEIFHLVFFVTFISVLLQGATIPIGARWLRVDLPFKEKFRFPIEFNPTPNLRSKLVEIVVPRDSGAIGKSLIELDLPKDVLIVLIQRHGEILVPRGGTQLETKDTLLVLSETTTTREIERLLLRKEAA